MIKVAIVEDNTADLATLQGAIFRYEKEKGISFHVQAFSDAADFLQNYSAAYDIVFMDIEMPYMSGMDAAHKLRELDTVVRLIFVTNMAQYAIQGYEVDALDYILKPIEYYSFAMKMDRALRYIRRDVEKYVNIPKNGGICRLPVKNLRYIEVQGHYLTFYTDREPIVARGRLSEMERELSEDDIVRCNNCYLVNLRYVTSVHGLSVKLGEIELPISRTRHKEFLCRLTRYLDGGAE